MRMSHIARLASWRLLNRRQMSVLASARECGLGILFKDLGIVGLLRNLSLSRDSTLLTVAWHPVLSLVLR